jgi:hypothetical protein
MNLIYPNSLLGIIINGNIDTDESAVLIFYEDSMSAIEDINNKIQENNTLTGNVQNNVGLLISL